MSTSLPNLPSTLVARLKAGQVIPFVGAGVSMAVRNAISGNPLFPSWAGLLSKAADRLDQENKGAAASVVRSLLAASASGDLLFAARRAKAELGSAWYEFLKEQLDPARADVDEESLELARMIWGMGNLVITTNYDRVLEWVAPGGNPTVWNIEAKAEMAMAQRDGIRRPTVWHVHGHIDDSANIILTPDGYARLYGSVDAESRYAAALDTLRDFLTSHTFLFIGFSLADEHFGQNLTYLNEIFAGATGPHYVILPSGERDRVGDLSFRIELLEVADYGAPLLDLVSTLRTVATHPAPAAEETYPIRTQAASGQDRLFDPANPVVSIPFRPKGEQVIGRSHALQRVRDQLTRGKQTSIGQTAAFQGIGGLGKTQLAVEYAWKYKDDYPNGVIWITADQDIHAQLIDLAVKARWVAPESEARLIIETATHRLRSYSDCLVIFDNVDAIDRVWAYFPEPSANPHLLLTSRTEQPGFVPIEIDTLNEKEAVDLLLQEANRVSLPDAESEAAHDIAVKLDGLPLALELAGAYLRHRPIPLTSYRDLLYANLKAALPPKFLSSHTKHEADLYATLRVGKGLLSESRLLRELLDLFAWSATAPIGDSLLRQMLGADLDLELLDALSLAEALRLIKRDTEGAGYSMHRLLRDVRREDAPIHDRKEWVTNVCEKSASWFASRRRDSREAREFLREIDHLEAWRGNAISLELPIAARLLWLEAYPQVHSGDYREALKSLERAEEALNSAGGADADLAAHLLADRGVLYMRVGNYKKGIEILTQAVKARFDLDGEKSEEMGYVHSHLADAYYTVDKIRFALHHAEKSQAIFASLFGEDAAAVAIAEATMAIILQSLGRVSTAFQYASRAVPKLQKRFGVADGRTSYAYNALGLCEMAAGNPSAAVTHFLLSVSGQKETVGDRHPEHSTSQMNLGLALLRSGQAEEAVPELESALTICRSRLGGGHPRTRKITIFLAQAYDALGRRAHALELINNQIRSLPQHHESVELLKEARRNLLSSGTRSNPSRAQPRKRRP